MDDGNRETPKPARPANTPDERTIGGYRLDAEIGRGGMGIVYRAMQLSLKRTVALKMLTGRFGKDDITRFLAEAETAAALQHPNIVHIYEVGETENVPFFAMEFIEGGTLADRIARGVFDPRDAATLMMTLAHAVHFAHQHGIVHRDLKPGNVLLDHDDVPKVVDFGIAKRLEDASMLTNTGQVMGTPCYMAPEQAGGTSSKAGPTADVYSLGAILYELLTGRPPFLPHESEVAVTLRVINEDPVSPAWHRPEIPRELEAICMMCLHKDTRDRYQSAEALADDLQRFLNDEPILAKPPTRIRRTVKWVKRHPARTITWAILFMLCGAGLQWLWQWEMYRHERIEYATSIDLIHGGIEGVGPMTKAETARRGVFLRLTRSGRHGPIVRAEAVNAAGRPAVARELLNYEMMPSWLQGVAGLQDDITRGRESVRMDVTWQGGEVAQLTAFDRNGLVTVRIDYERAPGSAAQRVVRGHFRDVRSFDFAMPSGASNADFTRDAAGRDVRITFFNNTGQPARNGEGVYGYLIERNPASGRIERLVNMDETGQPMKNLGGIAEMRIAWNARTQPVKSQFFDAAGQPTKLSGMASVVLEYDDAGNQTKMRRLNEQGGLQDCPDAGFSELGKWAERELKYNGKGEITELIFHCSDPLADTWQISRAQLDYDTNGYPCEMRIFLRSGKQSSRIFIRRDDKGNVLELKKLDEDNEVENWYRATLDDWGNPTLTEELDEDGEVESRIVRTFDKDHPQSEIYQDAEGRPQASDSGWSRIDHHYDKLGYRTDDVCSGFTDKDSAGKLFQKTYDEHGRLHEERWTDDKRQTVEGPHGWALHRIDFPENGKGNAVKTQSWQDAQGKPARNSDGYSTLNTEYDDTGLLTTRVLEGFDETQGYYARHDKLDPQGHTIEQRFRDRNGNKAWQKSAYHCLMMAGYTPAGLPTEYVFEDPDPTLEQSAWRLRMVAELAADNTTRKVVSWFEDKDGTPTMGPKFFRRDEITYDSKGRTLTDKQLGCSLDHWGAAGWLTENEWNDNDTLHRQIVQALDEQGQPVSVVPFPNAARTELLHDDMGRVTSRKLSGFLEQRTGFSSIEANFEPTGKLISAIHRRGDGTVVTLRVVIMGIDSKAQEQAKELRAGDILVSRNGEPVTSTFAMNCHGDYAAGWVEVERDGQRLRIDGFEAGKLGVALADQVVAPK